MSMTSQNIDYLYKYRSINEYTKKSLINNEFFFSFPSSFNDPFDTKLNVIYEGSESDWRKFIRSNGASKQQEDLLINYLKSINYDITKLPNYSKNYFKVGDNMMVFCLSEINNSILMWSHYSNSHKGICLGYKTEKKHNSLGLRFNDDQMKYHPSKTKGFLPVFKVKYQSELPDKYNSLTNENYKKLFEFAKTKHRDWNYEKEHRMIYLYENIEKQTIQYKKDILDKIIFGIKTSKEDKRILRNIIQENYIDKGFNVDFFQAEASENKYNIKIKKL